MAGLALTNDFMLSTATVMLGAMEDLNDLNPTENSIGLVKNFTLNTEPAYTELMQGVKGSVVYSVMTANPVKASMEAYEYTPQNIAYSLGLNGSGVTPQTIATTVSTIVPASPAQNTLVLTSATGFTVGKTIMIDVDNDDNFVTRKITGVSTNTLTLDDDLPAIAVGRPVYLVNTIEIGSKDEQPFLSAKIAGKLANGKKVVILIAKMRITKGFNMAFITNDYGNLPLEFTLYDLVSTDTFYADYKNAPAKIIIK